MNEVGERLREIRKDLEKKEERKISQREFAKKFKLNQDQWKDLETGRVKLKEPLALLICNEYGINFNWLLTGEGEKKEKPELKDTGITENQLGLLADILSKKVSENFNNKNQLIERLCYTADAQPTMIVGAEEVEDMPLYHIGGMSNMTGSLKKVPKEWLIECNFIIEEVEEREGRKKEVLTFIREQGSYEIGKKVCLCNKDKTQRILVDVKNFNGQDVFVGKNGEIFIDENFKIEGIEVATMSKYL